MKPDALNALKGDAQEILFNHDSERMKDFAARVLVLIEAYERVMLRAAMERLTMQDIANVIEDIVGRTEAE